MPYKKQSFAGMAVPEILLPNAGVDMTGWAVIACDQFTAQQSYWDETEIVAGDSPSALRLVLPEIYLSQAETRVPKINAAMESYLEGGVLARAFRGFVLVKREIAGGVRHGLIALLDLEEYDYSRDSRSRIRATEGTIISRLPPRVRIRENAQLELPHILVLIDDPGKTVIEPLLEIADELERLYDFDLMQGGGHISGRGVSAEKNADVIARIADAICALDSAEAQSAKYGLPREDFGDGKYGKMTFAMGDGNHSLATAKAIWEAKKANLSKDALESDPARYALVELNNLHEESLKFEPIHRLLMNCDPEAALGEFYAWAQAQSGNYGEQKIRCVSQSGESIVTVKSAPHSLPVGSLQLFLDEYVLKSGAEADYIHDDDALISLARRPGSVGFFCEAIDKSQLFASILQSGPLPRKTFSIGTARDKRYYLEARKIR